MKNSLLVLKFKGGLGNQMFQYALYKKLLSMGRNVVADLSWYETYEKEFDLQNVFPQISINCKGAQNAVEEYEAAYKNRSFFCKVVQKIFPEQRYEMYEKEDITYQKEVLRFRRGILDGYWQTGKYWEDICHVISDDFSFPTVQDSNVTRFLRKLEPYNTVSVHVRRGDYLLPENQVLFGNICTQDYYERAIEYMKQAVPNAKFVFFTNDLEWVKDNFKIDNSIFAGDYINEKVPDWYDMYLMSQCNHHIIANSTFSWWGAYLGKNKDKVVIAPSKWMNGKPAKDIYWHEWIKI